MKNPTTRHVSYAEGYAGLGLFKEARRELDAIDGEDRGLPAVLGARVSVEWEAKRWDALVAEASRLVAAAPGEERGWIGWAFALRELGCVAEAKAVLLRGEPLHGATSAVLHYNLGCYHCLLGEMADARARLATAFRLHPPFRDDAAEDPDLQLIWDELKHPQS